MKVAPERKDNKRLGNAPHQFFTGNLCPPFIFPCFSSQPFNLAGRKSPTDVFIFLIFYPLQSVPPRPFFPAKYVISYFYLFGLYLLLNYRAGSRNPGALLSKQSWGCVGSYTSWNALLLWPPHPICRKPIRARCRYSRRPRPYSRQTTMTWTWSGTARKR